MELQQKLNHLVEYLQSYESDTFSASASGVSPEMAEQMAARLIDQLIDQLDGPTVGYAMDVAIAQMDTEAHNTEERFGTVIFSQSQHPDHVEFIKPAFFNKSTNQWELIQIMSNRDGAWWVAWSEHYLSSSYSSDYPRRQEAKEAVKQYIKTNS